MVGDLVHELKLWRAAPDLGDLYAWPEEADEYAQRRSQVCESVDLAILDLLAQPEAPRQNEAEDFFFDFEVDC